LQGDWNSDVCSSDLGPRAEGTAAVHLMHAMGTLEGIPGAWGYVHGGMGRISFALQAAAEQAGAKVRVVAPVAAIEPGEGVVLEEIGRASCRGRVQCR